MPCQIGKADDLGGFGRDALPRCLLLRVIFGDDHLATRGETENLVAGGRRPTRFDLVLVSEERDAGFATAVVQSAPGQNAQERRFTSVLQA